MTAHKTASDMGNPAKKEPKPSIGSPLPEAFIKANEGPVAACGEIALPVWDLGPKEQKK